MPQGNSLCSYLKQTKFFFYKIREQESGTGPVWGLLPVGVGRMCGKGVGGRIWGKYCVHRYVNGKMRPAENIPGMGWGWIKDNDGGMNSTMIYLIYCKNFCKCHNVPPAQ
jgi:hypothetical protein